ncbi:uncharacterized protein [Venturia canescens]|uniref:uncharacterized protein n=1 Tax=Venturia canescens TaxID=32260 RepID=UPI001C9CFEC5|nr:uncharacterized protein LOC122411671 [Venturia canescens]
MRSFSSTLAFTTIFVIVNSFLVSSASDVYDGITFDRVHHFTDADLVHEEFPELMATKFIGDLTIGSRRAGDYLYQQTIVIPNPSSSVNSTTFYYDAPRGTVNYLSVVNDVGSYAAVCDFPYSLGSSRTYFSVRVVPNSRSSLKVYVAYY